MAAISNIAASKLSFPSLFFYLVVRFIFFSFNFHLVYYSILFNSAPIWRVSCKVQKHLRLGLDIPIPHLNIFLEEEKESEVFENAKGNGNMGAGTRGCTNDPGTPCHLLISPLKCEVHRK